MVSFLRNEAQKATQGWLALLAIEIHSAGGIGIRICLVAQALDSEIQ